MNSIFLTCQSYHPTVAGMRLQYVASWFLLSAVRILFHPWPYIVSKLSTLVLVVYTYSRQFAGLAEHKISD